MIPIPNQGAFTAANIAAIMANLQAVIGVTGNVYFLDPVNGNDNFNGLFPTDQTGGQGPVASLAAGEALLASGNNDVLVLIGNGTTSATARLSSGFTWAKNAAHLVGMCAPSLLSQRARIAPTAGVTAFANFFTVSGNGCYFRNLQLFQGFDTGVAASIALAVSGGRNVFDSVHVAGMGDATSAQSSTSRNLKISSTGENLFRDCTIGIDTVARTTTNASVEFAGGTPRNIFKRCLFPFLSTNSGVLGVKALTGGIDRFQLFDECSFINGINSSGVSMTSLGSVGANGGGPNGCIVYRHSTLVGIAEWEATTKTSVYVEGPAPNSGTGVAVNPA